MEIYIFVNVTQEVKFNFMTRFKIILCPFRLTSKSNA